jgi:hypothetical protein
VTNIVTKYKRGDSAPPFRAQLLDNTTPVDLTSATVVRLLMQRPDGTSFAQPLTVENQTTNRGWVNRPWGPSDLLLAGSYAVEVEVTWTGGTVQTFPPGGTARIIVAPDLG